MIKVQYNLFALKRQLELKTGKAYTWKEIAKRMGIHPNTMLNFVNNKITRVDLDILIKLVDFFNKEGLPTTFFDLFIVSEITGTADIALDPLTIKATGTVSDSLSGGNK